MRSDEGRRPIHPTQMEDATDTLQDGKPYLCKHLTGCARCHGDGHDNLLALPLTHPIVWPDGFAATHFAVCPNTDEPILWGREDVRFALEYARDAAASIPKLEEALAKEQASAST